VRAFLPWSGFVLAALLLAQHLALAWETNPDYSYGWLVPFLTAYLFWRRWETRPAPLPPAAAARPDPLLLVPAAVLFPLFLVLEANPDWRLLSWCFGLAVLALALEACRRAGGRPWLLHFAFPLAFFLVAIPWPTSLENAVIQNLMRLVAVLTTEIFNWCGVYAVPQGNLIVLAGTTVGVDEACSGVRSLQSNLMSALFVGELFRATPLRRLALLGIGMGIALLLNLARAGFLTWVAWSSGRREFETWHDPAGLAFLLVSFGILLVLGFRWEERAAPAPASLPPAAPPVRRAWILPAWIFFCLAATEMWYRAHEKEGKPGPEWFFAWPAGPSENYEPRELPERIRSILQYGEARHGILRLPGKKGWLAYEFVWPAGRTAAQLARSHSPSVCLPAGGARLVRRDPPVPLGPDPGAPVFEPWVFDYQGQPVLILYALWESAPTGGGLADPGDFYRRGQRLRAVLEGRRNRGQKVFEIVIPFEGDADAAEADALAVLRPWFSSRPADRQGER
jgi:exosortase